MRADKILDWLAVVVVAICVIAAIPLLVLLIYGWVQALPHLL